MSTGNDNADVSLLDLFRVEAETQAQVLETGLVRLEGDQTPARVEPLMRAAHSLKGAARIVGLDNAVVLAHAMEDVLVAVQRQERRLPAAQIDLLLGANDVFKQLAQVAAADLPAWLAQAAGKISEISGALRAVLATRADPAPRPPPAATPAAAPPAATPPAPPAVADPASQFVRIRAESLTRLMGLAGECLVQTKFLPVLAAAGLELKESWQDLHAALETLLAQRETRNGARDQRRLAELLELSGQVGHRLVGQLQQINAHAHRMESIAEQLYSETIAGRMRPFGEGARGFPRLVRDLARQLGKQVEFRLAGENTPVDRDILEMLEAPLTHILRNAVDHGLEPPADRTAAGKPASGAVTLAARHGAGLLQVTIRDDGRGIDYERLRAQVVARGCADPDLARKLTPAELVEFLFLPGFSTAGRVTDVSGRGVGLDVVRDVLSRVGGTVRVEAQPGQGTAFHLHLPLTLSVLRAILAEIDGELYALPLARIDRLLRPEAAHLRTLEERQVCLVDGEAVGLVAARQLLQLASQTPPPPQPAVAVISDHLNRYGLAVDHFLGQRELVVLPLDPRLGKVPNVSAGAVDEDGRPVLILDVDDLVRSIDNLLSRGKLARVSGAGGPAAAARKHVLVADDSLTVREVERKLLEHQGYAVSVAVDGMDAWNMLQSAQPDLVITDVDMPRLNGIELLKRLRGSPSLARLPVVIVSYKDSEADRLAGLEAGANHYLTKSSFQDATLLEAVRDLIGEP